jgi:hypothetical protein
VPAFSFDPVQHAATLTSTLVMVYLGLARTIHVRCIHGIFGREITNYTVTYGVYKKRFWPTLGIKLGFTDRASKSD